MVDDEHWQSWVTRFQAGDAQVLEQFWNEYGPLLHNIASKQMAERLRRRIGPEDVVQSACRTFFRRVQGGQLKLEDSESLWRLLCAITLTKIREQARFHSRKKRGMDQEMHAAPAAGDSSASAFQPTDPNPTPAEAAAFGDQFQQLLDSMDEEERQIIDLKLQEFTHEEVAAQLGLSERTVRRIFKRVQSKLARSLESKD